MILKRIIHGIFPYSCLACNIEIFPEFKNTALNTLCEQCRFEILNNCGVKTFKSCIYIAKHENIVECLIKKYKYKKQYSLAKLFAELCFIALRNYNIYNSNSLPKWDLACCIPSSKKSIREKRFNHSVMLANEVTKKCKLNFSRNVLSATRERQNQSKLNQEQRKKNIKDAFTANIELVQNKNILVIDDIITTGATFAECSKTLYNAGAKQVYGLMLAKRELYDF